MLVASKKTVEITWYGEMVVTSYPQASRMHSLRKQLPVGYFFQWPRKRWTGEKVFDLEETGRWGRGKCLKEVWDRHARRSSPIVVPRRWV